MDMILLQVLHIKAIQRLICGWHFKGEYSVELGKQAYTNVRGWLPHDDPWRSTTMKDQFNSQIEDQGIPNIVTMDEQIY